MDNRRKLSELIEAADNDTLKAVADAHPMLSDAKKDELYSRISERVSVGEDYADSVSGVEVRRGRGVSRYVGLVAAMALVIGGLGGGGLLLKQRAGSVPSSEIEATTEVTEAETETEAPTEAALTEDEAQAIVDDLFVKFTDFEKAYLLGGIEVDYSAPIYRTYVPAGAPDGFEVTEKFYPVTDERFRKWEDVEAACLDVFTAEAGYPIIGFKSKEEPYETVRGIDETITNGTTHIIDGSDWYMIWDMKFKTPSEWISEPRIEITPDGNIEAYRKRHSTAIAYKEFQNCTTRQEQMELDPTTLTPFEVEEDSCDIEEVYTIVNTDNGWRIADIKPVYTEEEYIAEAPTEADSEDYEAIARKLTDEYYEYIDKINGKALEIDRSVTIEKEETDESGIRYHNTYFLITDEELPNVEAARKRCFEIFDEEDGLAALKALAITSDEDWDYYSGNGFIDEGDCWYILEQLYDNTGVHTWTDDDEFSAELTPDGDIRVVRKTEYVSANKRYDETREFTLRKTDEGWRISDLYPVEQKSVNE